jgi:3-oxoacyl-[acyl-carrier protein] reductase
MRLSNKVAIITGSGQGIGKAIALGMAREGAKVVIAELNADTGKQTANDILNEGGAAMAVMTDVSSEVSTQEAVRKTVAAFDRVDILFNVAAYPSLPRKPWYEQSVEDWYKLLNVDLLGCFLCAKAVYPHMRAQRSGRIINTSSSTVLAISGSGAQLPYVSAKAGVIGLTRLLARRVGDDGINVNALMPGSTLTERIKARQSAEYLDSYDSQRCIKRSGLPEDLVGTAVFLASDDSSFITGQTILVDGGRGML